MRNLTLAAICIFLGSSACGGSSPTLNLVPAARVAATAATMTFAGIERTYLLWRPLSLARSRPAPLVVAMHGYTSSAMQMESMSDFDEVANENGFVVVYPEGIRRSWDAGWCCNQNASDDVGFISALIDKVVAEQNIDRGRVLATGMSNGAMMAQRLACELPGKITAAVSVSGSLLVGACEPSRPISLLEIHGVTDTVVPIHGGFRVGLGNFRSTASVMEQWAALDGCPPTPVIADALAYTTYTWAPCLQGTSVVLETVKRGGHSWFGPQDGTGEPDASRAAWQFLMGSPPLPI